MEICSIRDPFTTSCVPLKGEFGHGDGLGREGLATTALPGAGGGATVPKAQATSPSGCLSRCMGENGHLYHP